MFGESVTTKSKTEWYLMFGDSVKTKNRNKVVYFGECEDEEQNSLCSMTV